MGQLRPGATGEQTGEGVGVDAVGLQLDGMKLRTAPFQPEQGAVVGRALDDDLIAGMYEVVEEEGVGLE